MAFEPDFVEDEDEQPSTVECNRCGKGGLSWEETDDGYVLVSARTGLIHKCAAKTVAAGEFQPLG